MPFRFFRRVRIAPGVTINLSKSGPSVSVGPRGAKVTLGHGRVRKTVGLPGTGLYYTSVSRLDRAATPRRTEATTSDRPAPAAPDPAITDPVAPQPAAPAPVSRGFWSRRSTGVKVLIVLAALLAAYLLGAAGKGTNDASPTGAPVGLVGAPVALVSARPAARSAAIAPARSRAWAPKAIATPTATLLASICPGERA